MNLDLSRESTDLIIFVSIEAVFLEMGQRSRVNVGIVSEQESTPNQLIEIRNIVLNNPEDYFQSLCVYFP